MKRQLFFYTLLLSCTICTAQKKIALIVAISKYQFEARWRNLSSLNDMHYITDALKKNGFTSIDTITDARATKAGIVKALDELYAKAGVGDVIYFHFSGHGQQIQDDNGDEADGYDEALVPYDADGIYDVVSYHGENHLRDDLLGEKLEKIRKKIGTKGSLVAVLDACHSGTATRDAAIKRGTEIPFQEPGYKPNVRIDLSKTSEDGFFGNMANGMGTMIAFSACSPNQPNYEMKDADKKGVGSLSYAFAKAISELPENSSYRFLFEKMKAMIQADIPTQIPMVEGNIDQEVFGGRYIPKPDVITVQGRTNDSTFTINEGLLSSMNKGSTLMIFPLGSKELFCKGLIKETGSFQSTCSSSKPLVKGAAYEVKIDAMSYGDFSASLTIRNKDANSKQASDIANNLSTFIKNYQYLSIGDNGDYTIDITKANTGGYSMSLIEKGDSTRYSKSIAEGQSLTQDDFKFLLDGIKRNMRVKYLRTMNDGGSFAKDLKVELVPKKPSINVNETILKSGDGFDIKITNTGNQELFYTIIDMMPNNDVKVLIPEDTKEPQDYTIRPKQSIPIGEITVDNDMPNGKELFKVIVSKEPMDLRNILNRSRSVSRSQLKSVEEVMDDLFKDSNDQRSTRSTMSTVKIEEVGIATCGFTIKN